MAEFDEYRTIKEKSKGFYKDKGSKFHAFAYPIVTEDEFKENLQQLKKEFHDARHHVYAFRLGADKKTYRASDDGEPANSSGPPILGQLHSYNLTNIMIVVIRYFGGTKLGIPGLINAYKTAAADAIENATIITKRETQTLKINFGYPDMDKIMRLIKEENLKIIDQNFHINCSIILSIRKRDVENIHSRLNKIENITAEIL